MPRLVLFLLQHAHSRLVVGAHFVRDGHALRDREPACILRDVNERGRRFQRRV